MPMPMPSNRYHTKLSTRNKACSRVTKYETIIKDTSGPEQHHQALLSNNFRVKQMQAAQVCLALVLLPAPWAIGHRHLRFCSAVTEQFVKLPFEPFLRVMLKRRLREVKVQTIGSSCRGASPTPLGVRTRTCSS